MIYQLLSFVLCLQLARACVPMKPGEDMPCPSVPQAPSAMGYVVSGLKGPTYDKGAKVYKCNAPEKLLQVEGTTVTELMDGATISCKPNSAMFVTDNGIDVGSKKYTCGELAVPCPPLPEHTGGGITGVKDSPFPAPTMMNGDMIWECGAAPAALYQLTGGNAGQATKLPVGSKITCKRQSGKLTLFDGPNPIELDPQSMDKFICGSQTCALCPMDKLVDKTVAACSTQANMFCTSKPTLVADANGCSTIGDCPNTEQLFLLLDATTSMGANPTQVKCDTNWKADGTTDIPANAVGFVCGKGATCLACNGKVSAAYTGMEAAIAIITDPNSVITAKPTCTYKCPAGYNMKVGAVDHKTVVCDMVSEKVTVDMLTGMELTAQNQFNCAECKCPQDVMQLNDGSIGLCPMGTLCTAPAITPCEATCPTDASAIYKNAAGTLKMSPTIKCNGADWIEAGKATGGITCQFAPGKGIFPFPATPPGTTVCPLTVLNPCPAPATSCDAGQLITVTQAVGGYTLTCKEGSLVTDKTGTDLTVTCSPQGTWNEGITQATCATDVSQVQSCFDEMDPAVAAIVDYKCQLGTCYLMCKTVGQQFEYIINDGINPPMSVKNALMKCYQGQPLPVDLVYTDGPSIKCV